MANNGYKNISETGLTKEFLRNFDKKVKLIFINVAAKACSNLSVSNVSIDGGIINQAVRIKAAVQNHSLKEFQNLPVSLYIGEAGQQNNLKKAAQSFLSIKQNETADKDFFYNFSQTAVYLGNIAIFP